MCDPSDIDFPLFETTTALPNSIFPININPEFSTVTQLDLPTTNNVFPVFHTSDIENDEALFPLPRPNPLSSTSNILSTRLVNEKKKKIKDEAVINTLYVGCWDKAQRTICGSPQKNLKTTKRD